MLRPVLAVLLTLPALCLAQAEARGKKRFEMLCASCHGADGAGGERGPDLTRAPRSEEELSELIRTGVQSKGMPPFDLPAEERQEIASFVRSLARIGGPRPARELSLRLDDGTLLRGLVLNESNFDLQIQDHDGRLHFVRRDGSRLAEVKADATAGDWPTYHGNLGGNRHSPLRQIHTGNTASLAMRWLFPIPGSQKLEVTPVVEKGVMYVTSVNEVFALDAFHGRPLWHWRRARTPGLAGDAAGGINRGVALLGDRLFLVTDNAHLIALDRLHGRLLWDVEMADSRQNYGATSAPLVVRDLVISGVSGGDEGIRGFVDAYRAATGERVWRFWTIPAPGDPLAGTWRGRALEHGCGATWLTGTYDPSLDLLYWPVGNPCPDYNGDEREGDNLYSCSVLALKPASGKLAWFYQFTPHDVHDWDAQQTPMLVDATFRGRPRKLLLQASRNGFFYVLDRVTGELLAATPFVHKLTWASGIGKDGRPVVRPEAAPTPGGVTACPAVSGATNWMSTAYHPGTGLFYVMALEKCEIYRKAEAVWQAGKSHYGGSTRTIPDEPGQKFLRALDIQTGKIVWEVPQAGPANTWGGVLSTAGGVVFYGDDSGAFAAVDAKNGKPLWHFHTGQLWKASPMTYLAGGAQFVAVAAGGNILAFALPADRATAR